MGSVLTALAGRRCAKCQVPLSYYAGREPSQSCRVHRIRYGRCLDCDGEGNCRHQFGWEDAIPWPRRGS